MHVFLHDGSFDGLLTALSRAVDTPDSFTASDAGWQPSLLDQPERVRADPAVARKLLEAVRARIAPAAVRRLLYLHHAEDPGLEPAALEYLCLGVQLGRKVEGYHTHPAVQRVLEVTAAVGGEIHRLKGLLRFRRLASGWLWAPARPDHDIILPVALHFRRRLSEERWGIHDVRRGTAVTWADRRLEVVSEAELPARLAQVRPDRLADEEPEAQALWKTFFENVAIPDRRNPRVQRQNVPERYWPYLIEQPGRALRK